MEARLKAVELVEKFKQHAYTNMFSFRIESNLHNAKKCALIAVDELIKDNLHNENIVNGGLNADYWQEVKTEINNL